MKSYSDISFKYIKENKKRSVLTILGITLAVVLIFAVGTFGLSFFDSMIEQERERADFEFSLNNISKDKVEKVKNNVEVKDSSIRKCEEETYIIKGTDKKASLSFGNDDFYKKIYDEEDIIEGSIPKSEDEVVLDSFSKSKLDISVGDKIILLNSKNEEKEYKISGISKYNGYVTGGTINLEGYLGDENYLEGNDYRIFINLKSPKDKQKIISEIINDANITIEKDTRSDNSELLYLTGNGGSSAVAKSIKSIAAFVIIIIVVCTITVIYNSFNISVIERMRYFGVLKAIGATPRQIKSIIFKEGFLMGLVALPIGCLIGFLSLKFGVKIFIGDSFMMFEKFKINFYPSVLLFAAVLEFITIYFSLIIPVRKAKKVSAVDAMRNKNEIKIGKIKRRKGRIIQKIFGIEGSIAYKNIRRTPMRFIVTIIALTISIILFNVFYGFMDYGKQIVKQQFVNLSFDSQVSKTDGLSSFTDDEMEKIEGLSFSKDYYKLYYRDETLAIDSSKIDSSYTDKTENIIGKDIYNASNYQQIGVSTYVAARESDLDILDDYLDKKVDFSEFNDGGVILVDGVTITNSDGKKEIVRMTSYKVGDTIKIPKSEDNSEEGIRKAIENNSFYEAKILGISNMDPYNGAEVVRKIELIFSDKGYEKLNKKVNANGYAFKFNGDAENREEAAKYFSDNAENMGCSYMDVGDVMKQVDTIYGQIEFFVYCFIIIVTVISIVNIYNTISTSILLRKKEFSTLKAIGMTEYQLNKSVILEGTLYGIISAIFGGIISVILSNMLINMGGGLGTYEYHFPYIAFTLSIVAAIFVTYLSTIIPLRRLRKLTIVEGISDEE